MSDTTKQPMSDSEAVRAVRGTWALIVWATPAVKAIWGKATRPSVLMITAAVISGVQVNGTDFSWVKGLTPTERLYGGLIAMLLIAVSVLWEKFTDQGTWQRTEMADIIKANTAAMTTNTLHHLSAHQHTDEKLEDLIAAQQMVDARMCKLEAVCGVATEAPNVPTYHQTEALERKESTPEAQADAVATTRVMTHA